MEINKGCLRNLYCPLIMATSLASGGNVTLIVYITLFFIYKDFLYFMSSIYKTKNKSTYLCFSLKALSSESIDFVEKLIESFPSTKEKPNRNKLKEALGSITGALLEAYDKHPEHRLYRRCGSGDFTGSVVSYRSFTHAINGLKALSLIDWEHGYCPISCDDPSKARAFNFRAKSEFIDLANKFGIQPSNWSHHFEGRPRPEKVSDSVVLKACSVWERKPKSWKKMKVKGGLVVFDTNQPLAASKIKQVNEINSFFAKQDIQPSHLLSGFQRIFSQGDDLSFKWNKGGRLYALHGGYQQEKGSKRAKMMINGEKVVEIDIKASHLTILHALHKKPFDLSVDPYSISGFPRIIVKQFVTATLGKGKIPARWSKDHKEAYAEANAGNVLQKEFPFKEAKKAILKHLPILTEIEKSPWNWADFQFLESEAIIGALYKLAFEHGIPALPVHDSLIVPVSKLELAKEVLSEAFLKSVGIRPELSVKGL